MSLVLTPNNSYLRGLSVGLLWFWVRVHMPWECPKHSIHPCSSTFNKSKSMAQQMLDMAQQMLDMAQQMLDMAQQMLDMAQQMLDMAQHMLDMSQHMLDMAQQMLDMAQQMLDVAQQMLDMARNSHRWVSEKTFYDRSLLVHIVGDEMYHMHLVIIVRNL